MQGLEGVFPGPEAGYGQKMSNRRFAAVTTFNDQGYAEYGRRCLAGFDKHWPAEVTLHVYYEGTRPDIDSKRIVYVDLLARCPDLVAFKARHADNQKAAGTLEDGDYGYRMDAVRFSHKVFALADCALSIDGDVLFWLDADTVTFNDLPLSVLEDLLPPGHYTSYLGRGETYPECGFVGYDLSHPQHRTFMEFWRQLYLDDSLFDLPEWHDSFVYDLVRKTFESKDAFTSYDICGGVVFDHPFINCVLGTYMDHMKGDERKAAGSSFAADLERDTGAEYWKNAPSSEKT